MEKLFAALLISIFLPFVGWAANPEDHYRDGLTDYQAGKWQEAVSQLQTAIKINPNRWAAYQLLGYCYYQLKDGPDCVANCDASLKINPNNPTLQAFVDKVKTQNMPAPNVESAANLPGVQLPTPDLGPETHDSFYVNLSAAGPVAPTDFSLFLSTGLSVGAGYGFGISKVTSIVLTAQYTNFPLAPGLAGGAWNTLMFLVNGKFILVSPDNPVVFYLISGIGPAEFFINSATVQTVGGPSGQNTGTLTFPGYSETDLAFRFGIGIDIKLAKGLFLNIESDGVDTFISNHFNFANGETGPLTNSLLSLGMRFDH